MALDYKFGTKTKQGTAGTPKRSLALASAEILSDETPSGGVSSAAVNKRIGPVSFANIGLQFRDEVLSIVFDASLARARRGESKE